MKLLAVINLPRQVLNDIRKKTFPDTLLMGLNNLPNLGIDIDFITSDVIDRVNLESTLLNTGLRSLLCQHLNILSRLCLIRINKIMNAYDGVILGGFIPTNRPTKKTSILLDLIVYNNQHFKKMLGLLVSKMDAITYNARSERSLLLKMNLNPKRLFYLPWGIDKGFFKPLNTEVTPGLIVSVGNANRDYITLIRAVKNIKGNFKVKIVTGGTLRFRKNEQRYHLNQLTSNLNDKVEITRRLHPIKLRDLYARAQIIVVPVYPSESASGITAVLEAMAMGKPCIVTRSEGLLDYVTNEKNAVLIRPFDAEDLRKNLLYILENEKEASNLGRGGRKTVESSFNTEKEAQVLHNIIKILTSCSDGRSKWSIGL